MKHSKKLVKAVKDLARYGIEPAEINSILLRDPLMGWIWHVPEGTWADTQNELKEAKRAFRQAIQDIYDGLDAEEKGLTAVEETLEIPRCPKPQK